MQKSLLSLLTILLLFSCKQKKDDLPLCLNSRINEFKKSGICEDAKVVEYIFQNELVYVFESGSCGADLASEVTDDHCNTLGFLGGITGNTTIEGTSFDTAVLKREVWKNKP